MSGDHECFLKELKPLFNSREDGKINSREDGKTERDT